MSGCRDAVLFMLTFPSIHPLLLPLPLSPRKQRMTWEFLSLFNVSYAYPWEIFNLLLYSALATDIS